MPLLGLLAAAALAAPQDPAPAWRPDRQDVTWTTPSADQGGTMPLGNGDVALNAWVKPDGALRFTIAKGDAWSGNGRLLKVGRVCVTLEPPLPTAPFRQTLRLADGAMVVEAGAGDAAARLRLWVDANAPVIRLDVESATPRRALAAIESWRTERVRYPEAEVSDLLEDRSRPDHLHEPVFVEPDTVLDPAPAGTIGWYHHNATSHGPALIARLQGLEEVLSRAPDPLLDRTFGALVFARDAERLDARRLRTGPGTALHLRVHVRTEHPATPEAWLERIGADVGRASRQPPEEAWAAHRAWWQAFWERSWIQVTATRTPPPVPANDHPLRLAEDQRGGNRFVGDLADLAVHAAPLLDEDLIARAAGAPGAVDEELPRALPGSADLAFPHGLTLTAWARPTATAGWSGRLFDKITPGGADGFLLDAFGGTDLRLIVGGTTLRADGVLVPEQWNAVAARIDPATDRATLFVAGLPVATTALGLEDEGVVVSRGYALQRYVNACAGRGRYPIKFNGSLFTVATPGKFGEADYRRWGPGYWWQNTRLPYLGMCASGDLDLLEPLFRLYVDTLPVHRLRTRLTTGHAGAYLPECIDFWGPTFTATWGWTPLAERGEDKLQESGWHKREWVSGLELTALMLDRFEYTQDREFARGTLLPMAHEVLTFFDQHYADGPDGHMVMAPAQALETWWDCTDPMPELAGLHAVTARLLALPGTLTRAEERSFWSRLRRRLPPLPTVEVDGVRRLAPAARFADKRNVENPELYAVFPFRLVSFEQADAALGVAAFHARTDRGAFGWRQDDLFAATLGLTEEARALLVERARHHHAGSRFPAFFGPNYDWVPDQDHGGVLVRTLQLMLLQTEGRALHLLPAWPPDWDADFRLHAPLRTTLTGRVRGGVLEDLVVDPPERRADVVVHGAR